MYGRQPRAGSHRSRLPDLESDDMLPVGLPQTASEQVATNGALEEGAASTNVFEPNARTPFAAVPFAPQLHMYRQNFQQNIMVGESPEQTRSLLGELEIEAENRHQRFRQAAEYAHDQRIANVEERANRQHEEIVAQLESEIATQRYQFIEANHHLVSELRQQHQVIAFQTEHFSSVSSQITQLRTTLIEEAEENKTQTLNEVGEWFGREHDQAMQQYRLLARESEEEMRRQNDVLQDELSSAERALKLEQDRNASQDTASQAQFPPAVTPATVPQSAGLNVPTAPQFSSPSVIPLSLRAMFSGFGGAATTATPAGPRAPTQAPGTPVPSTGLGGGVSGLAVPMGTPASPAATGVDLIAQTQQALLEAARLLKGDKGGEDDKPKVKEAENIRLPDFPNPETYRAWKTATREAVRAASDRPDEAFSWILEVYAKDADHDKLREPGKFLTLDTKILAALTKVAKGELSRQVLTFKETEAVHGRAVRGRQVLLMFDQYFKTNEEVGSLYSVEDLLKVTLHSDDLTTFLHNWESVIAGMSHVPEEMVLRDILLRQIRKSSRMKYDLEIYDRAKEGSASHSYAFLLKSIRDLLTRERMRKNRDRIAKSHGDKFGAPVLEGGRPQRPPSRSGRGRDRSAGSQSNSKSRSRSRTRPGLDHLAVHQAQSQFATIFKRVSVPGATSASSRTNHARSPLFAPPRRRSRYARFGRKANVPGETSAVSCIGNRAPLPQVVKTQPRLLRTQTNLGLHRLRQRAESQAVVALRRRTGEPRAASRLRLQPQSVPREMTHKMERRTTGKWISKGVKPFDIT